MEAYQVYKHKDRVARAYKHNDRVARILMLSSMRNDLDHEAVTIDTEV